MTAVTLPRSVAPNYDVPENVSPFVPLPMLTRCSACGDPQETIGLMSVVRDGKVIRDVCPSCAEDPS